MREIYVNGALVRYQDRSELYFLLRDEINCARRYRLRRTQEQLGFELKSLEKPARAATA
jgi:hypothetical protein